MTELETENHIDIFNDNFSLFKEMIRDFFITIPLDLGIFFLLTLIIGFPFLTISDTFYADLNLLLLYMMGISVAYAIYLFYAKQIILGGIFGSWSFVVEKENDPEPVKFKNLQKRIRFISNTKSHLFMKMGELNSFLWSNLDYIQSLEKLIEKGISIEIFIRRRIDVEDVALIKMALYNKIKVFFVEDNIIDSDYKGHFIIQDSRAIWISEPHPPFENNKYAHYSYGPTDKVKEATDIINQLRPFATLLTKDNLSSLNFVMHGENGEMIPASEERIRQLLTALN